MSANCRAVVFEEEQEEVLVMGVDHQLLMGCKHEIKSHCPEQNEVNGLLNCLKEAMEEILRLNPKPGGSSKGSSKNFQQIPFYRLCNIE